MRNREHEWFQYQDGILDEATWLSYRGIIRITLSSKRHRAWWNNAKAAFNPEFVTMVDQFLKEFPESEIWDEYFTGWEPAT